MNDFVQQAAVLAAQPATPLLDPLRQRGRERWLSGPLPTRKSENWKYTPLRSITEGDYLRLPESVGAREVGLETLVGGDQLGAHSVVFVNGQFSAALSSRGGAAGLHITRFSDADEHQQARIGELLGSVADYSKHPFVALNEALVDDGVFVDIDAGADIELPVQICNIVLPQAQAFNVQQRALINVGDNARVAIIERYISNNSKQNAFTNSVTEINVGDNASLAHYYLDMAGEEALHIGGVHVTLARDARYHGFQCGIGGNLQRMDLQVTHAKGGSHCELGGIYLPHRAQLVDFHVCVEHSAPHCTSNEIYRGIVGDAARAVFNGRIHIHPQAQKTSADLSNKNLLTSHNAEVNTKPELEIYADDVKCSHGATVAQLDDKALYYLRSRGIDRKAAVMMLSYGFIAEVLAGIGHKPLRELLEPILERAISEEFHLEIAA